MARTPVNGTNGNDRLDVFGGFKDVFGKGGNDTIVLKSAGDTGGNNFVDANAGNDAVVNHFEGGCEIRLGSGNDTYVGLGFAFGGSSDAVFGGPGNDLFAVQTLQSSYFGEADNDTFVSVGWRNSFNGGSGTDTISYEARSDDSTVGHTGVGVDLVAGKAFTGNSRFETLTSIENVRGSNNGDEIYGNSAANMLEGLGGHDGIAGGGGNDTIRGGSGNDELHGESGNDTIFGDSGNDTILGQSGDDKLRGGTGKDTLSGGSGADTFIFKTVGEASSQPNASTRDVITDFTKGSDKIDLSGIDAKAGTTANDAFVLRSGENTTFSGAKGQLIWDKQGSGSTAKTIVMGDTNGDKAADFHIELKGHINLAATDFIL